MWFPRFFFKLQVYECGLLKKTSSRWGKIKLFQVKEKLRCNFLALHIFLKTLLYENVLGTVLKWNLWRERSRRLIPFCVNWCLLRLPSLWNREKSPKLVSFFFKRKELTKSSHGNFSNFQVSLIGFCSFSFRFPRKRGKKLFLYVRCFSDFVRFYLYVDQASLPSNCVT